LVTGVQTCALPISRFRIVFGIGDRDHHLDVIMIRAPIALLKPHLIAVRITEIIEPLPVIQDVGINEQSVSFPVAYRITVQSWRYENLVKLRADHIYFLTITVS